MRKTGNLPGTEDPKIQTLIDAAEVYEKTRNKRQKLTEQEVEDNAALVALLKEHGLKQYRGPEGLFVTLIKLEAKARAKVQRRSETDEDEE